MISIKEATELMRDNIIGPIEIESQSLLSFFEDTNIPQIPFDYIELQEKKEDYLLILGKNKFADGKLVTIRNLIEVFGKDPKIYEPCFYNQDWYDNEEFIDVSMKNEWCLIRKSVYEDSRAVTPDDLIKKYTFPTAISCTYSFFMAWICKGIKLWYHDFVWCSDLDHNGDRIYVGKYNDVDGLNKNGFSIHRHLGLRKCYGCVD